MKNINSEQKIEDFKVVMLNELNMRYQGMILYIKEMPISQDFKSIAMEKMSSGFLWVKEAINQLNLSVTESKFPA